MSAKRGGDFLLLVLASSAAALLACAIAAPAFAQDGRARGEGRGPREFRSPSDRPPRDFGGPPRGFDSPPRPPEGPQEATAKAGFLFIDGEYLPPSYEIRHAEDGVTVNGRK